jgi:hypothetical protein
MKTGRRRDKCRQAGMINFIVNFCNFVNVPKLLMFKVRLVLMLPYGTALNLTKFTNTYTHKLALQYLVLWQYKEILNGGGYVVGKEIK